MGRKRIRPKYMSFDDTVRYHVGPSMTPSARWARRKRAERREARKEATSRFMKCRVCGEFIDVERRLKHPTTYTCSTECSQENARLNKIRRGKEKFAEDKARRIFLEEQREKRRMEREYLNYTSTYEKAVDFLMDFRREFASAKWIRDFDPTTGSVRLRTGVFGVDDDTNLAYSMLVSPAQFIAWKCQHELFKPADRGYDLWFPPKWRDDDMIRMLNEAADGERDEDDQPLHSGLRTLMHAMAARAARDAEIDNQMGIAAMRHMDSGADWAFERGERGNVGVGERAATALFGGDISISDKIDDFHMRRPQ